MSNRNVSVTVGEASPDPSTLTLGTATNASIDQNDSTIIAFNDGSAPASVNVTPLAGQSDFAARRDHVHSIVGGISTQMVNVRSGGTFVGSETTLNFINGGGLTITVVDNAAQNRVDITLSVP